MRNAHPDDPDAFDEERIAALTENRSGNLKSYRELLDLTDEDLDGTTILDIGSGTQQNFAQEVERDFSTSNVYCVDARFDQWHTFPKRGGRTVRGFFTKLPFPDEMFDRVVSVWGMPLYAHRKQLLACLTEAARVLRPGGKGMFFPLKCLQPKEQPDYFPAEFDCSQLHANFKMIDFGKTPDAFTTIFPHIQGIRLDVQTVFITNEVSGASQKSYRLLYTKP